MKFFILSGICIFLMACLQKVDPSCHAQVLGELIKPVYITEPGEYAEWHRFRIHCAGKCPDRTACDSLIELTNTSMGASVRRVKCGCNNDTSLDCGIFIERIRYSPDTIVTRLLCMHGSTCPVRSDTCKVQEQPLATDTIRSVTHGTDSLIVLKWISTCECMEK